MTRKTDYPPYTLGLDIGIASVGAALLDFENQTILNLHVRAFNKAETDKEGQSLNLARRTARLSRRRLRRRAFRLVRLLRLFKRQALIAHASIDCLTGKTELYTPWYLRAKALDKPLNNLEWATVLYHIIKHRGFQSNRKSELADKENKELGSMLTGISSMQSQMQQNNWRTVGEMLAKDPTFDQAKRNKGGSYSHTIDRQMLVDELPYYSINKEY